MFGWYLCKDPRLVRAKKEQVEGSQAGGCVCVCFFSFLIERESSWLVSECSRWGSAGLLIMDFGMENPL